MRPRHVIYFIQFMWPAVAFSVSQESPVLITQDNRLLFKHAPFVCV